MFELMAVQFASAAAGVQVGVDKMTENALQLLY